MFCNKNHQLLLSKAVTLVASDDRLVSRSDRLFASADSLESNDDRLDSNDGRLDSSVASLFNISVKALDVKYPLSFANWLTLVGIDVVSALEFQFSLSSWVT